MSFLHDQLDYVHREAPRQGIALCVTLELRSDAQVWVQLTEEYLNLCYPLSGEPVEQLAELGVPLEGVEVVEWESEMFVTLAYSEVGPAGRFLTAYVVNVLRAMDDVHAWNREETVL